MQLPQPENLSQLPEDGGPDYNRLIFESSPYLLQHATNPVDWHAWSPDAFQKAREQDKPIFLSIGYATCHWCHVMAHESFESTHVAEFLNANYISIKVDKEERPDIDHIYMTACQLMTGQGGWPLTIFLDHDQRPFLAGTYFPVHDRYGRPGFFSLLNSIHNYWHHNRDALFEQAEALVKGMTRLDPTPGSLPELSGLTARAFQALSHRYDARHGGFGHAPKFPSPHNLTFLLQYGVDYKEPEAQKMVIHTLACMRRGGIFDQVGRGFHRYSTDAHWLLPHFEKMLYDQAMLLMAYGAAFRQTGDAFLKRVADEICAYVQDKLQSPEGAFYSAEDADSEGEEGKFYVWKRDHVMAVLGEDLGPFFSTCFNLSDGGNFADEATGAQTGENIPHLSESMEELAKTLNMPLKSLEDKVEKCRKALYQEREKRPRPLLDDKVLTDWNGLMIGALAQAGMDLDAPHMVQAARQAADFLKATLMTPEGTLHKRYRAGQVGLAAHLDDYAFAIFGLLGCYRAMHQVEDLEAAVLLQETLDRHFWDGDQGGYFATADNSETLIHRAKTLYDGAIPSGNSIAADNCLRLGRLTGNTTWSARAEAIATTFSESLEQAPNGATAFLQVLMQARKPAVEVVIAAFERDAQVEEILGQLRREFDVPLSILLKTGHNQDSLARLAPFTAAMALEQKPWIYVCVNQACSRPTQDPQEMLATLKTIHE